MSGIEHPIAVFDSGIGGISVLRELIRILPQEHFIFFGDSANAPYGTRPLSEVRALTQQHIHRFIREGAKEVVIACNTATSAAVKGLRAEFPGFPIIGIEPALKPAAQIGEHPTVVVMATPLTLREEKFHEKLSLYSERAKVIPLPCPGLVELIEQGILTGHVLDAYLEKLLQPLRGMHIDAVVLGCTHYPHVQDAIQRAFGPKVALFDGGEGTAREARRQLALRSLLRPEGSAGSLELHFTKEPERMKKLAEFLLSR